MSKEYTDLRSILDIAKWELLQDEIAKLTGVAITTIDYKGTPITRYSGWTDFCSVIRDNPVLWKRCYKCAAIAGLEAVRNNKPYIYLCHCGIADAAVPIIVGNNYLGAVMFGQVRIAGGDAEGKVKRIESEISSFSADKSETAVDLLGKYNSLPELEYDKLVDIADFVSALVQYTVGRFIEKKTSEMTYEWMLRKTIPSALMVDGDSPHELSEYLELDRGVTHSAGADVNSVVYPAVQYLEGNINTNPSLKDMANLCHLSESYFSKVFKKETGVNYSDYVTGKKIAKAKELLRQTSMTVTEISGLLGYIDSSYFVKVFKKTEGVTPLHYRQFKFKG